MVDIFTPEKRSKIMSSIKGKDTKIEILLRKALWSEGIRGYRLNAKLPGKPDIVFSKYKIAIFCDGDFWHGKDFDQWKERLTPYWKEKIQKNIERDKKNDARLLNEKWLVLHFWESEILKNVNSCVLKITKELRK
ncbi:MAG: very short patch repair endonuclease [Methanoregula sp.]|nr:very short patch repair endonuclease [Methanoregula sp.]